MSIDTNALRALPAAEKLRIIEMLCEDLENEDTPISFPEWVRTEGRRRLEEMRNDPTVRLSHEEMWQRIDRDDA